MSSLMVFGGLGLLLLCAPLRVKSAACHRDGLEVAEEPVAVEGSAQSASDAKKLAEVRAKLVQRYVKKLDDKELTEGAIRGIIGALKDPYCSYLTQDGLEEKEKQIAGTLSGIGVQIRLVENRITVLTPLEDSPALRAGIRAGDLILAIDGKTTKDVDIPGAVKMILGAPGTKVKLKIQHTDGKEAELAIERTRIRVHTVRGFRRGADDRWETFLDPDNQIGYLQITAFNTNTVEEMQTALKALADKKIKGLILDLRFCPGGLLPATLEVAGMFVAEGTLVTVRGQNVPEKAFKAEGKTLVGDIPVMVLLNGQTASSAEILAGILRDHNRAIAIGTRSFGKGSVQEFVRLEEGGGALLVTTAYFYLPSGRNIHKAAGEKEWGVDPTDGYYLPMSAQQVDKMLQINREQEYLGKLPAKKKEAVTARMIEEVHADLQLAGALKSMTARIREGQFIKVGKSLAELKAEITRRDDIQKRRESLLNDLDKVNKELSNLDKGSTAPDKR
jgi:carboxyl-terminal processing protease